jgi:hypothetical protein
VEIFESFAKPIVNAAQCLVFNWKHFSSVNWWNKFGKIGTTLQHYHIHTQGFGINGSLKGSIKLFLKQWHGRSRDSQFAAERHHIHM